MPIKTKFPENGDVINKTFPLKDCEVESTAE